MTITHILIDFENTQPSAQDVALLRDEDQRLWIFRGPSQRKYDAEFAEALLPLAARVRVIKCEKSGRNALDMHIAFQMGRLLGELTQATDARPAFAFVVVSRDTDYEPLLQYIRGQGYAASRVTSVREALGAAPGQASSVAKAGKSKTAAASVPPTKARSPAAKSRPVKKAPAARAAKVAAKAAVPRGAAKSAATAAASGAAESIDGLIEKVIDRLRDHPKNRPTRRDRMESWLASHLRSKLAGGDVPAIVAALEQRGVVNFAGNKIEYPLWL
jgi:hypothetical protein